MRPYRRAAVALTTLAVLLGALLPASAAHAESRTVRGGRLDWGIKSSFQNYVTGPIAQGSHTPTDGASTTSGNRFRFHSASGSYDPETGAFHAAFEGGVHFTGHKGPDGGNELDLRISRPTVRAEGGSGTLYADLVSKARGSGKVTRSAQVPFARLNLSGVDMRGGGSPVALNNVPATLTSDGAKAFAGYYSDGTALDPVSLSVDVVESAPKTGDGNSSGQDSEDKGKKEDGKKKAKNGKDARSGFEDAAVDWGVRRTFREYVTGPVAKGRWKTADGARDGGAVFRFPEGTGTYDEDDGTLTARFAGSVRFTGHDLDLKLSRITVRVAEDSGTLAADVTHEGTTDTEVPLVTFPARDLEPEDGLATVGEAPAKLTARGAKAFASLYPAGTAMDPVTLSVAVTGEARLPALPDLGSDTSPRAEGAADDRSTSATEDTAAPVTAYVAAGAAVLAALTAGGVLLLRRRARAARAADESGTG
ncbi:HtaA domain-containing protein [Streptomyces sp. NPDC054796]